MSKISASSAKNLHQFWRTQAFLITRQWLSEGFAKFMLTWKRQFTHVCFKYSIVGQTNLEGGWKILLIYPTPQIRIGPPSSSLLTAAAVQFEILSLFRFTPDDENRLIRNLKRPSHPHKESTLNNTTSFIKHFKDFWFCFGNTFPSFSRLLQSNHLSRDRGKLQSWHGISFQLGDQYFLIRIRIRHTF